MAKPIFYHSPNSRSTSTFVLLEELGAPYEMRVLNMEAGEQRKPEFLKINPMGKVPAIVHDGALITEQPAIFIYLADAFPEKGLAPKIGDKLRGPYLRWTVFYGSSFEPAIADHALKREPGPPRMMGYGDYDTTLKTLTDHLAKSPYMLGERFSALDVLWGMALAYTTMFKIVPELPMIMDYLGRFNARPAVARVRARNEELAAQHKKATG